MRILIPYLTILFVLLHQSHAINFDLPPGKTECFYEDVHQGTNINGVYAVTQGGSHMDIDVTIFDPKEKQVYTARKEGEDKFMLKADMDGSYKFCFGNTVSIVYSFL